MTTRVRVLVAKIDNYGYGEDECGTDTVLGEVVLDIIDTSKTVQFYLRKMQAASTVYDKNMRHRKVIWIVNTTDEKVFFYFDPARTYMKDILYRSKKFPSRFEEIDYEVMLFAVDAQNSKPEVLKERLIDQATKFPLQRLKRGGREKPSGKMTPNIRKNKVKF